MQNDTQKAKEILIREGYTCVLCRGEKVYSSTLRGVKPLLDFLDSDADFRGFSAADKTVGAGAAHLYLLLGVDSVWAKVISRAGLTLLEEKGISVQYEQVVPYIINRTGDGMCPMEKAVTGINDSCEALVAMRQTLQKLTTAK